MLRCIKTKSKLSGNDDLADEMFLKGYDRGYLRSGLCIGEEFIRLALFLLAWLSQS